jgi:hypothetical protein
MLYMEIIAVCCEIHKCRLECTILYARTSGKHWTLNYLSGSLSVSWRHVCSRNALVSVTLSTQFITVYLNAAFNRRSTFNHLPSRAARTARCGTSDCVSKPSSEHTAFVGGKRTEWNPHLLLIGVSILLLIGKLLQRSVPGSVS